ncbi:MAG: ABC transporter permease subunit [Campylobacterota bacterium]|nr:ABC transporter permease subunit [Campylobacterota bacterium]
MFSHTFLIGSSLLFLIPVWVIFASSTHQPETILNNGLQFFLGDNFIATYKSILFENSGYTRNITTLKMILNSLILALGFAIGKVIISSLAAYAIVYFRFRLANFLFWLIFLTLLLPLEVRIVPSFEVLAKLNLLNSYTGLILPLIASATGTFFFRQFYKSIPDELLEAAKIDGANSWQFFVDILVPLSRTMMAALFIVMFIVGWNQYLWPIMMTTEPQYQTILLGIKEIYQSNFEGSYLPEFNRAFAIIILALVIPVLVVILLQRWFVKGLVDSDK